MLNNLKKSLLSIKQKDHLKSADKSNRVSNSSKAERLRCWCSQTWPELYRYAYSCVRNREEAEDVTQETYTRLLARFSSGDFPSEAFLKKVALNIIRDRWRRQKTRGIRIQLEEALLVDEREISKTLDSTLIEEIMLKLSEEQQMVIRLRILEGYSRGETAQKMQRSQDAIRGLQYRAVKNLKKLLQESLEEADG